MLAALRPLTGVYPLRPAMPMLPLPYSKPYCWLPLPTKALSPVGGWGGEVSDRRVKDPITRPHMAASSFVRHPPRPAGRGDWYGSWAASDEVGSLLWG